MAGTLGVQSAMSRQLKDTKQGRLAVYPSSRGQDACQVGGQEETADFSTYS